MSPKAKKEKKQKLKSSKFKLSRANTLFAILILLMAAGIVYSYVKYSSILEGFVRTDYIHLSNGEKLVGQVVERKDNGIYFSINSKGKALIEYGDLQSIDEDPYLHYLKDVW